MTSTAGTIRSSWLWLLLGAALLPVTNLQPLLPVASLVSWLAPVVNEIWEHGVARDDVRRATAAFVAALVVTMLLGGARLAFDGPASEEVRVAALAPDRALN